MKRLKTADLGARAAFIGASLVSFEEKRCL